ncbi:hypothetical protein RHMOL_Rhmol02G0082100 [Rhododendron molle]|uniref:Uncharacterized protein n=1 Tax=Rhododendron molle TaxID=49168 RepID=A0ACC0PMM3_RHOML|nr:hypothetical protein RHMOL_Rhmol02G0082100 [Rhododendron molle]
MAAKEIVCSDLDFSNDSDLDFSDEELDAMNLEELKAFYNKRVQKDNKVVADLEQSLLILTNDTARLEKEHDEKKIEMLRKRKETDKLRAHGAALEELKALSAKKVYSDKEVLAKLKELKLTLRAIWREKNTSEEGRVHPNCSNASTQFHHRGVETLHQWSMHLSGGAAVLEAKG